MRNGFHVNSVSTERYKMAMTVIALSSTMQKTINARPVLKIVLSVVAVVTMNVSPAKLVSSCLPREDFA